MMRPIELCGRAQEVMWMRVSASMLPQTVDLVLADKQAEAALSLCRACDRSRLKKDGQQLCLLAQVDVASELRVAGADFEASDS